MAGRGDGARFRRCASGAGIATDAADVVPAPTMLSLRGAIATKQSTLVSLRAGLLRGACHRARVRATRWLAKTGLETPQTRKQCQAEQRDRAEDEAECEGPEPAAARFLGHDWRGHRGGNQRMFALDHAARDIVGDGVDDDRDVAGFGEHDAAEAGILHETIDA